MLAMHSHQSSVQNPSPVVNKPSVAATSVTSGAGPFRCAPTSSSLFHSHVHAAQSGSAIESPSSSDDSQSHSLNDDTSDELLNDWHHQDEHHLSSANAYRMRRESDQTSPSSATSATFADPQSNNVSDAIDPNSPDALAPKIEELDDDGEVLMDLKPGDDRPADDVSNAIASLPRKRGRPRKHPLPMPGGQMKVAKGRSKTGCITCRRRKKKCDETKPACKELAEIRNINRR